MGDDSLLLEVDEIHGEGIKGGFVKSDPMKVTEAGEERGALDS